MTIRGFQIAHARRVGLAVAMVMAPFACASDDDSPPGAGGAGGTPVGQGGAGSSSGGGTAGTPIGGSGGGGLAGTSGSAGHGGSAGADAGAGKAGSAGTGRAGAGGAAGVDGGGGAGGNAGSGGNAGAAGSAGAGKGGASGATGSDAAAGSGGAAGSTNDAGTTPDGPRDVASDATDGPTDAPAGARSFHCVNWADPRDNFVNGNLELSGLSAATDTYATVQTKASEILAEFQTKLKADSIRIPINEPTVSGTWWNAYKGVIDTAVAKGMKVVVAYWAYQNGKPADATAFKNMWQVVVSAYERSDLVYFDIHNEPYGYGSAWNDAAAQWLADFPSVPRGRVIVAGTGYDDNVNPVGSDPRFAGCILELHIYGFWHTDWTAQKQWRDSMTSALGAHAARTLVGEWGAPMTTGIDYGNTTDGDAYRSYVLAVSNVMHDSGMGSCYWPGLRDGDSYSMSKRNSGSPITLTVNSASGLARLHWAWNVP